MQHLLVERLAGHPRFADLAGRLGRVDTIRCGGLWGSARALLVAACRARLSRPLLVVAGTSHEAEDLYGDLQFFLGEAGVHYFPYVDTLPYEEISPFADIVHHRIAVLHALVEEAAPVVVAPVRAVLSRLVPAASFVDAMLTIRPGDLHEPAELVAYLARLGYGQTPRVERSGEFSLKGGILDVFPSNLPDPCRIEFFDVEVESIRSFRAETQVSFSSVEELVILPQREILLREENLARAAAAAEKAFPPSAGRDALVEKLAAGLSFQGIENYLPLFFDETSTLTGFFRTPPVVFVSDPDSVERNAAHFLRDVRELHEGYFTGSRLKLPPAALFLEELPAADATLETLATDDHGAVAFPFQSPRQYLGSIPALTEDVRLKLAEGETVLLAAGYEGQAGRMASLLGEFSPIENFDALVPGKLHVGMAPLSTGFLCPELAVSVILEREVFNRKRSLRRKFRSVNSVPIDSFLDLHPGDFVVHVQHGIGRFLGLERLSILGKDKDYLKIEYRDEEKLYVPLEMINLVQRYLGAESDPPRLDTLGGRSWERAKAKVRANVEETAKELAEIYAARLKMQGRACGPDTRWQHEFESGFEFEETPDQQKAIDAVKADMEDPRPMDRLVCGDVGFGKTEVAIRAAFKAVMDGCQVAVLVPTTILAEQHYRVFKERFELYPVRVDYLNRFRTPAEQKQVVKALAEGEVDVVVGTHRLLSADVRFKNLGLVVVDEEQRFGVKDKERLKQLRKLVDVIAMTATPIPRTLHLSLIKVRDLSIIETPPRQRLPVETYVMEFNEAMVKRALLQELDRGGQVYYLHNRVQTIEPVYEFLKTLVPRARIGIAHGQLPEHLLEEVMRDFIDGVYDVLLCTSIIESGLDIPNANTLIVDRADSLGLAQLYQIRGRVGRAAERAYAYLFYPAERPLTEMAQKRLQVITEFTELGSGFRLALRDMEIRGVGSLLGREQSGDILAVGFDMYCRLLDEAVRHFGIGEAVEPVETVVDLAYEGFIPDGYVPDERQKIEVYKRIASCTGEDEVLALRAEVRDRFGPPPPGVDSLFKLAELKAEGRRAGVKSVLEQSGKLVIEFDPGHRADPARAAALLAADRGVRPVPGEALQLAVDDPGGGLVGKVDRLKKLLQAICP